MLICHELSALKMMNRFFLNLTCASWLCLSAVVAEPVLSSDTLRSYVTQFNQSDEELYANIPNAEAFDFLENNIPLFDCPDPQIEWTYYFRWWKRGW